MAQQIEHIKWIHGTNFMVDGFNFQNPKCKNYFLTHFHSDHTTGSCSVPTCFIYPGLLDQCFPSKQCTIAYDTFSMRQPLDLTDFEAAVLNPVMPTLLYICSAFSCKTLSDVHMA